MPDAPPAMAVDSDERVTMRHTSRPEEAGEEHGVRDFKANKALSFEERQRFGKSEG